ncbi:Hypothetical protein NTJ_04125 [Nesidiocoris tenuis]|uniref:Uncharacterized protein n=1 Tax=Nesidiocoris tenuis TaxID=355587 RepID=A0ABN7AGC9_9HEMI|nr:Hypothetical protein NTJ_04125 [Nesidiocoris tenuis]
MIPNVVQWAELKRNPLVSRGNETGGLEKLELALVSTREQRAERDFVNLPKLIASYPRRTFTLKRRDRAWRIKEESPLQSNNN